MGRRQRGGWVALVVACVLGVALSGCQLQANVFVEVQPDGAGVIEVALVVDAETMAEIGGASRIVVSDLDQSSWVVTRTDREDGSTLFRASQRYMNAGEASQIFGELAGPGLPVGLTVARAQTPGKDTYSVNASADLSAGSSALLDSELADLLGDDFAAPRLGGSTADRQDADVAVSLGVQLPGWDGPQQVSGTLGQPDRREVSAVSTIVRPEPGLARVESAAQQADSGDAATLAKVLTGVGVFCVVVMLAAFVLSRRHVPQD